MNPKGVLIQSPSFCYQYCYSDITSIVAQFGITLTSMTLLIALDMQLPCFK